MSWAGSFSLVYKLNCRMLVCSKSTYDVVRLSALHAMQALAQTLITIPELGVQALAQDTYYNT